MSTNPITRDEALALLRAHKATLEQRFDVTSMALFGSTARNEATADSDVDILVSLNGTRNLWRRFFEMQFYLEDVLGRPVDLATHRSLRPRFRPYIEGEAIYV